VLFSKTGDLEMAKLSKFQQEVYDQIAAGINHTWSQEEGHKHESKPGNPVIIGNTQKKHATALAAKGLINLKVVQRPVIKDQPQHGMITEYACTLKETV
jgi:hypothetical protein